MRYSVIGATLQQVEDAGGKDVRIASNIGFIFASFVNDDQVTKLRSLGCIIKPVGQVKALVTSEITVPTPLAGEALYTPQDILDLLGIEEMRSISDPPLYGANCTIAIVDTGIRGTHKLVQGRVVYSKSFVGSNTNDGFDHGTGVASIISSFVPRCNIVNIRVLDDEGMGTEESVTLGIDEVITLANTKPDIAPWVINLSLGSPDDGDINNPVRVACRVAIDRGIWVVAAAGNDGPDPRTVSSPACERYVVAIGSVAYNPSTGFSLSQFSSRGPTLEGLIKPDGVMVGEDLIVASAKSDTATLSKSGTSFSAPMLSGILLMYREAVVRFGGVAYRGGIPVGLDPAVTELVPIEDVLDTWAGRVSLKPEGAPAEKDNNYGYGVPFGPLMSRALGLREAAVTDIMSLAMPIFSLMILGTLMKGMTGNVEAR